ncbi:MFS transporter [Peribacillus acanthi]|uniref:MFS transporter n=1 Tax=Peribacillus acanthi TaxID=2171554 RepID=UPI000D3E2F50|nr:MFS transporter [Peribacillus acanthi]
MEKQNSRYRWIVFTSVVLAYLLIVSQRTAPGLVSDHLMDEFKITATTIGLLTSIQFLAYVCLQIPIGILSDRFGPNFFLIIGTMLNGIGTLIYSFAPNEIVMLLARLLVGIGDATIWVNLILILSQWFKPKEFVGLLGIAAMGGSVGFLLATVPFSVWIDFSGWRLPFFTTGLILTTYGILLYFILVKIPNKRFKILSDKHLPSIEKEQKRESTLSILIRLFTSRQAWATFLCHFGVVGTYVGFIGSWAVPYGMQMYDLTRSDASQLIMIGLIGAMIGAPLTSSIASKLDTLKRPYLLVQLIVLISWTVFILFSGKPPFYMLIILFFIIGYGNGASALTFAVVRQSFDMKDVGVVSGFANTGGFLSAVLLPSIFGKVLDYFQTDVNSSAGYHYGFVIPVIFSIVGLIGVVLIKEKRKEVKQQGALTS